MTVLVTGATGNVGRHVVDRLARAGAKVRAFTRRPGEAAFPDGVEVIGGDLSRPDTVAPALDGVERMYLFPQAYLTPWPESFADVIQTTELVELARKAGVRRLVMLGSSDPDFSGVGGLEQAVRESGLEWTILRPGEFAVNKLDYWAPSIRAAGVVRAAYADAQGTPIHEVDIAEVATAALLEDGHTGKHYELTGPEVLTVHEQVAAIAKGIGRPIRFEELTHEQAREELLGHGMPAEVIDELILAYPEGYADYTPPVSPAFQEVTGRPGRTLAEWAADHAAEFREEG